MYLQYIRCIKHILVVFQVCVKRVSGVSIKCIVYIKKYIGVSKGVLGVSDVYKVYQTYISNDGICDILPLDVSAGLRFPFSQIIKCMCYELNYYNLFYYFLQVTLQYNQIKHIYYFTNYLLHCFHILHCTR